MVPQSKSSSAPKLYPNIFSILDPEPSIQLDHVWSLLENQLLDKPHVERKLNSDFKTLITSALDLGWSNNRHANSLA